MTKKKYRPGKKVRISGITEKLIVAGLILCCVVVLFFSTFVVLKSVGRSSLKKHAAQVANQELSTKLNDETEDTENVDEPLELEEGQILVNGEIYEYCHDRNSSFKKVSLKNLGLRSLRWQPLAPSGNLHVHLIKRK